MIDRKKYKDTGKRKQRSRNLYGISVELGQAISDGRSGELELVAADEGYRPRRDPIPTDAAPGSREKVKVIMARVESGEALWHPLDRVDYEDS